ncbi:type I glyceraldehyde-3-phosphate dehydrogenase [Enterobacteriaceae endosymbiont of Neohaemonia nigricornis]|uniref:type I glyceraldehyde-3-phosphate dehydrogenase n=1 Tax=Enterobacteriaceae endosymbiont of Neohaemonia nigricornis TaxID=2675792 RepID=UPI001449B948|nr:type I glyceraldehyde-3-phosphate dehydrogenase [Enterobacteriaceae endosymbiont of Neohaemonia nigricornis]QJC30291.1 type I glyceraldehyde-3-phosphate dehydrogenase [Enterobacteriaceae endosymbiont of Neohaemonia nigricornis]
MSIKVAINGFGRIGRMVFRAAQNFNNIKIVAINDLLDINYVAYMLKFDSTHGRFNGKIKVIDKNYLMVNKNKIFVCTEKDPIKLQWNKLNIDVVIESTGIYLTQELVIKHIIAGAKKVVITAPPKDNSIPMYVKGVNFHKYNGEQIVSNASCTTNCLAPLTKIIHDQYIINQGLMTTVHAVTSTQKTVDSVSQKDWRGGRGAYQNIIPSSTGAAKAVGLVLPELKGKLTGISLRVPVSNVSVVDLTVQVYKKTNLNEIYENIKFYAQNSMKDIISYTKDDVVSSDFNGSIFTSIFDKKASIYIGNNFFKLIAWYDNETGYSYKVLDLVTCIMS